MSNKITVSDEFGKFETEFPESIPAILQKRKEDNEREQREQFRKVSRATELARIRGFFVLSMLREQRRNRLAELVSADCPFSSVKSVPAESKYGTAWNVETQTGSGVVSFFGCESLDSVLLDSAGFPWLLFTVDHFSEPATVRAYSVGVFESVAVLELLRGVSPDDFKPDDEPQPAEQSELEPVPVS